eukprot:TRINITY_DN2463_c0_g1_i6.p1 TRINITY_DN2463_c0_g1~~TRINITY_DN2463_c0_g1_i6.p1  ORF type:complete len:355 (+),score=71.99 TRINITY_DN2463_c0_g1_i6:1092-2156(+)
MRERSLQRELQELATDGGSDHWRSLLAQDAVLASLEIDYADLLVVSPPIARGGFGIINKARYRGTVVAVKTLIFHGDEEEAVIVEDFRKEVRNLSIIHHPNVVLFIGACFSPLCIVLEYMSQGSLYDVLRKQREAVSSEPLGADERLTPVRKMRILIGAAQGMAYLHANGMIHRDLKSPNILLDNWVAKVADFGSGRSAVESATMTVAGVGTIRWTAPEILRREPAYSFAVDVYSWAIIMWEVLTEEMPFDDIQWASAVDLAVRNGARPLLPVAGNDTTPAPEGAGEQAKQQLCPLIAQCWADDPRLRPSFPAILSELVRVALIVDPEGFAHEVDQHEGETERASTSSMEEYDG